MGNFNATFYDRFNISKNLICKREDQYQLSGSKNKRIRNNVCKISEAFNTYDKNIDAMDRAFHALTNMVLPEQVAKQFLDVQEIGEEKYQSL